MERERSVWVEKGEMRKSEERMVGVWREEEKEWVVVYYLYCDILVVVEARVELPSRASRT